MSEDCHDSNNMNPPTTEVELKLKDVLARAVFVRKCADMLVAQIDGQYPTEEQRAEAAMLVHLAEEIEVEAQALTAFSALPDQPLVCRHCGQPVHRLAGMWIHKSSNDFDRCRKAGIPRGA